MTSIPRRKVNKIIVHCSDSDHDYHDNVKSIKKWHVEERGWSDIGYHYIITKDGKCHVGRPIEKRGAHCKSRNGNSIGICLTGKNEFSEDQFEALKEVTKELRINFGLGRLDVYPHKHFDKSKSCPNFDINDILKEKDSYEH